MDVGLAALHGTDRTATIGGGGRHRIAWMHSVLWKLLTTDRTGVLNTESEPCLDAGKIGSQVLYAQCETGLCGVQSYIQAGRNTARLDHSGASKQGPESVYSSGTVDCEGTRHFPLVAS